MIDVKKIIVLGLVLMVEVFNPAAAQKPLVLSKYSGENEIKAPGSVTLIAGFHIPSGSTVRIFTIPPVLNFPNVASRPSSNQNYMLTRTFKMANVNNGNIDSLRKVSDENQSVQYFDGLGRPSQAITIQGSPSFRDIVQPIEYDAFGREVKKYLSYVSDSSSSDGRYKTTALADQLTFYNSPTLQGAPGLVSIPGAAFSEIKFERSPLNRTLEQGEAGASWQLTSGHTTRFVYGVNNMDIAAASKGFAVRLYTAAYVEGIGKEHERMLSGTGYYKVNELALTINKNENWTEADGKAGTVETYIDKQGRTVLKRLFNKNDAGGVEILSTYYVYDDIGNLSFILPSGADPDAITLPSQAVQNDFCYQYRYDERKRLIEKKVPGKGWGSLVYNNLDQLVLSQDAVQANSGQWLFNKYDVFGRVIITGLYSDVNRRSRYQMETLINEETKFFETKITTGNGYSNQAFPTSIAACHSINYYDHYQFPGNDFGLPDTGKNEVGGIRTQGLLTGNKTAVLGTETMLLRLNYYDDEGRVLQVKSQNHLGGTDVVSNNYNFAGELKESVRNHTVNGKTTVVSNQFEYDHVGRKHKTMEKINNGDEIILSKLDYNEIGQLSMKSLHSSDKGNSYLQNTTFGYNERGWLKRKISTQFSMELLYDDGASPQFNGNVANQKWGTGSSFLNNFTYGYDALSRLKNASSTGIRMTEALTYDVMGNISTMNRDGEGANQYKYNGNRLSQVSSGPLQTGLYQYDENGNAIVDGRNKLNIGYNVLNLPAMVTKIGLNLIYTYNAVGNRLKKSSNGAVRNYVNGIEYVDNTIDIIHTDEGIARNNGGIFSYEYNLSDQLGNVRYSFRKHPITGAVERLQSDDYYAFGKRKSSGNTVSLNNKYLYNGKEIQEEMGEQYDYGARFYDPTIGRWNVVDPKSELLEMSSPYVYSLNSPANFIDKDGELPIYINGNTEGDSERGNRSYWDAQLLRTIASSGMPNPGGQIHWVDGNRGRQAIHGKHYVTNDRAFGAMDRFLGGQMDAKKDFKEILAKLERDPKTNKIIEKIQIYTHSRGAAFGAGYTDALLELIKENRGQFENPDKVIEFVLNLAPHQSDSIEAPVGSNSFSIDHSWDGLSGDDMGNNTAFTTNTGSWSLKKPHKNGSFGKEVGAFLKAFQKSKGDKKQFVRDFASLLKSYGIDLQEE